MTYVCKNRGCGNADPTSADDGDLPATGVGIERERYLSPSHIRGGEYGTRSATVLALHRGGQAQFSERSFDREGVVIGAAYEEFRVLAQ